MQWLFVLAVSIVGCASAAEPPRTAVERRQEAPPAGEERLRATVRLLANYRVDLPEGFVESQPGDEEPGVVAHYWREDPYVEVYVTATMADAYGGAAAALDQWSARILKDHHEDFLFEKIAVWSTPEGRAFEAVHFLREGCNPSDRYVRYIERSGLLYRVQVAFPPGTPKGKVAPFLRTFFDAAMGPPPTERVVAVSPPPQDGPC